MTDDDPDPDSRPVRFDHPCEPGGAEPVTADGPGPRPGRPRRVRAAGGDQPMTDDPDDPDDPGLSPARLEVVVMDGRGRPRAADGLPAWLAAAAPRAAAGLAVVALVGDRKMRDLNRRFRGVDRVTDVLSFPSGPNEAAPSGPSAGGGARWLGDIVIATGRAARQARAAGLTESQEQRRLALHGLLHLLGYDHERDDGRMRRLERRLQRRNGLPVDAS